MSFANLMEDVTRAFEAFGVVVLVVGLAWSLALAGRVWRATRHGQEAYRVLRSSFGAALLLGLEILVAADLIKTVAVATTLENVIVLGLIVLIRTFLSFSLEVEIEGTLPRPRRGPARRRDGARGGPGGTRLTPPSTTRPAPMARHEGGSSLPTCGESASPRCVPASGSHGASPAERRRPSVRVEDESVDRDGPRPRESAEPRAC